jgi:SAM-dependent methyltransferase
VIWQEVECRGYAADLGLWRELAAEREPVLELGSGVGRVALALARDGHEVWGIDSDPAMATALRERAAAQGLRLRAERGDATHFALERRFALVIAPMQLIQLLPGSTARRRCLRAIAAHLSPSGLVALSIVEAMPAGIASSPPLPDVRELDGRVHSSLPLRTRVEDDLLLVERLRQIVEADGRLSEARDVVRLRLVGAAQLEEEARAAGLRPAGRRQIEPTESHVGSTVVLLER